MEFRTFATCICLVVAVATVWAADEDGHKAKCEVKSTSGASASPSIQGMVYFEKMEAKVKVNISLTGFSGGAVGDKHGFHIHQNGNLSDGCSAAGGHYNPDTNRDHGARTNPATTRHVGDLGNIVEEAGGVVTMVFMDSIIKLEGDKSIMGRAVVIHAGEDDLGLGGETDSKTTGHAGARYACCIIEEDDGTSSTAHNVLYSAAALVTSVLVALVTRL